MQNYTTNRKRTLIQNSISTNAINYHDNTQCFIFVKTEKYIQNLQFTTMNATKTFARA